MNDEKLLRLALEAIERGVRDGYWNKDTVDVSTAIQKRLLNSTPPAQEFVCSTGLCHYKAKSDERLMETLKQEPDAYGYAKRLAEAIWKKHYQCTAPQWEPFDDLMGVLTQIDNMTSGLTTLPAAQRQWVGLTDDEIIKCTPTWGGTVEDVARAVEAKLKEKNA